MTFGPYKGVVDQVHDGDTVYVKLDLGFDITVYARCRIYGINAPELSTPEGKAARDFAQALLPVGTAVSVMSYGWDKYGGRIDADIQFGSPLQDFALEMLSTGHAVKYP
jgi:endonuclease YncB( thermonuclease family)